MLNVQATQLKPLVSLDIRNSQPYFSLLLFHQGFYQLKSTEGLFSLKKVHPDLYSYFKTEGILPILKHLTISNNLSILSGLDVIEYRELVLNGTLYETFSEMAYDFTNGRTILTREESKVEIYKILFGNIRKIKHMETYKVFKKNFPSVCLLFSQLKSRQHNDVAILLQRIESEMVIRRITKSFNKKYSKAPLFTIHDSILTTGEYVSALRDEINDQLKALIGHPPKLEEKILAS